MDESDQLAFGFDLLDPTKFVPEELVPITPVGKMTLNMNPIDYFAETEQIGVRQAIDTDSHNLVLTCLIVPTWSCRTRYRLHG
jgi:catalase